MHNCFVLKAKITLICFNSLCHSLSFVVPLVVIRCHSLSFIVTRCTTRSHSLSFLLPLVICCHSLSLIVPLVKFVVTRCHSLSFVVPLLVTVCHSMYHSSVFLSLLSIVIFKCPSNCYCFLIRY